MPHQPDLINHPPHYTYGKGMEVIDVIEAFDLPHNDGAALKYLLRWRHKGGVEDLKKCRWYIERMIANAERPTVTYGGDTKEELSRSRGLGGEDRESTVSTLPLPGDIPRPGTYREPSSGAYVPDPRD